MPVAHMFAHQLADMGKRGDHLPDVSRPLTREDVTRYHPPDTLGPVRNVEVGGSNPLTSTPA